MFDATALQATSAQYPLPKHVKPSYGTAGFRSEASLLTSTIFRCGLLTAARALTLKQHCGIMITASHNPEEDNGVKIVEPTGEMLTQAWEPLATELACATSDAEVSALLQRLLEQSEGGADFLHAPPSLPPVAVLLGWDTRPSAPLLVAAASAGVRALGAHPVSLGLVTTPQLHFQVLALNKGHLSWSIPSSSPSAPTSLPSSDHVPMGSAPEGSTATAIKAEQGFESGLVQLGQAVQGEGGGTPSPDTVLSLDLYFKTLLGAFKELMQAPCPAAATVDGPVDAAASPLYVDCANGVGAQHLRHATKELTAGEGACPLSMVLLNTGEGRLNHGCGADFVQKEKRAPPGFESLPQNARCCSIDGDADRLVYFQLPPLPLPKTSPSSTPEEVPSPEGMKSDPGRQVLLLDGDKISALVGGVLLELVKGLPEDGKKVEVGVVQTAYANGASTHYLQAVLGLTVACTKTGVKHLHEVAHGFDIGIYFEANGHGTVLFSPTFLDRIQKLAPSCPSAKHLVSLSCAVNQSVGDALSCILMVEFSLRWKGWSLSDWQSLYTDLPSKQTKLAVQDRSIIVTTDAERRCVSPPGLQDAIDAAAKEGGAQARAFVRPSGTEDVVRLYVEAQTMDMVDRLTIVISKAVQELARGV